jgi:hypothetical protein
MILPTEVMCIESASILNQTNARASSFTIKFFIICQNGFWKKAFPSGLAFVSYNIELTSAAASTRSAWNLDLHAPIQTKSKATGSTICYPAAVIFSTQRIY